MKVQNASQKETSFLSGEDLPVTQQTMNTIKAIIDTTKSISDDSEEPIFYESLSSGKSSLNSENMSVIDDVIFSPITSVVFDKGIMTIGILLITKTQKSLANLEELKFHYQFEISDSGLPQLSIYISFNEASSEGAMYWDNTFQVIVDKSISSTIDLSEISTVEVFLIDEDPRTTRGTVTTVKKPM